MSKEKETKQYSIKFDLQDSEQKKLNDFLENKPTTYILTEALKLYMLFEEARKAAIGNAINSIVSPQPRTAAATPVGGNNDDLEDFEL